MAEQETLVNDFPTDTHRRVLGNLGQPRTLLNLVEFIRANDPYLSQAHSIEGANSVVEDLIEAGDVVKLGTYSGAKELIDQVRDDDNVPTLHKDKAKNLRERLEDSGRSPRIAEGEELYYWTEQGLGKLQGPVPNEPPPLEGDALERAQEHDRALEEETKRLEAAAKEADE